MVIGGDMTSDLRQNDNVVEYSARCGEFIAANTVATASAAAAHVSPDQ